MAELHLIWDVNSGGGEEVTLPVVTECFPTSACLHPLPACTPRPPPSHTATHLFVLDVAELRAALPPLHLLLDCRQHLLRLVHLALRGVDVVLQALLVGVGLNKAVNVGLGDWVQGQINTKRRQIRSQ
jgi:hypothetical protein